MPLSFFARLLAYKDEYQQEKRELEKIIDECEAKK